jgi:acid phosphatase
MGRRRREPRGLVAAALAAALVLAGCGGGGPDAAPSPAASAPSPIATVSATPTATPRATAKPSPAARPTVLGVLGDWGVDDAPVRRVVRMMRGLNGGRPLDAIVTTGDNAYPRGTAAEAAFARRVIAPLRASGTPLYAALGNHDAVTDGGRHVMAALDMPARWYERRVGAVQLVVLDSTRPTDAAQLAFLDRTLAAPRRAAFRVVVFHHPVSSCSAHDPVRQVREAWVPRFADRVDLVLAGHNHTYERFTAAGTPYVTTGGGGAPLYPSVRAACRGHGRIAFYKTVHHAVRLTATPDRLLVEAVGLDGAAFDSVTVSPRDG